MSKPTTTVGAMVESIRRHAAAQGLSIAELCFYSDISYSTWHRWITGQTLPRVASVEKMLATKAPRDRRRSL